MNSAIQPHVTAILREIGENPDRDGLQKTPDRVARMWVELTSGYRQTVTELINDAIFDIEYDEMVVVRDIQFYSLCEHHLLPFFGVAHVAYIPGIKVVGLSKIPRIVEMFARRLQVQERLTTEIADVIQEHLQPQGVAVVIQAQHLCMAMRGVRKEAASMITSKMYGNFQTDQRTRQEFLALIRTTRDG